MKFPWDKEPYIPGPNDLLSGTETGAGLITRVAGLAPLGAGAYFGYKAVRSNQALSLSGLSAGSTRDVNRNVGDRLSGLAEKKAEIAKLRASKITEEILNRQTVGNILRKEAEQRNILLASILETLDDPVLREAGVGDIDAMKRSLMEVMNSNVGKLESEVVVQVSDIVGDINAVAGATVRSRFERNKSLFGSISGQIAPALSLQGIKPNFTQFDAGSLSAAGSRRLREIEAAVTSGSFSRELVQVTEEGGGVGKYLKVWRGDNKQRSFLIGLDLPGVDGGGRIMRTGSGITTSVSAAIYGDADRIAAQMASGGGITSDFVQAQIRRKGGMFYSAEDMAVRQFTSRMETLGGDFNLFTGSNRNAMNAALNETLEWTPRGYGDQTMLGKHLRTNQALNSSQMKIMGMQTLTKQQQSTLRAELIAANQGLFDPASDAVVARMPDNTAYTSVGFRGLEGGGGAMGAVRPLGVDRNRVTLPATARIRQIIGRPGMFVNSNLGINSIGTELANGIGTRQFGSNIGFADDMLSGAMNKITVMYTGDSALSRRAMLGQGEAFMGSGLRGGPLVREALVKTVLDPEKMGLSSSDLLNELIERKNRGLGNLTINGSNPLTLHNQSAAAKAKGILGGEGLIKTMDDFYRVFGESGRAKGGAVLGMMDSQLITLPKFSGIQGLSLGLSEATDVGGRHRLHLAGETTRSNPFSKVFGMFAKATTRDLNAGTLGHIMGDRMGVLHAAGVTAENVLVTEGSMLKKGSHFLATQMTTGFAAIGGGNMNEVWGAVDRSARNIMAAQAKKTGTPISALSAKAFDTQYVESVTRAVARQARGGKFDDQALGMVFGGVAGYGKTYGVGGGRLGEILATEFGADRGRSIFRAAQEGAAIGVSSYTPGPQAGTLRTTLGSMEPRFYNFLSHNLKNVMGLSADETTDFMASIVARKADATQELQILKQLNRVVESTGGQTKLLDTNFYKNLNKVSVDDFIAQAGQSENATREFLRKQTGGFLLEFGPRGSNIQTAAAAAGLGGGREMFIAGGDELMDMLSRTGTEIKAAGGTTEILDPYTRRVHDLAQNLSTIRSTQGQSNQALQAAKYNLAQYKSGMGMLWAQSFKGLLSGKMRGSMFMQGASVALGGAKLEGQTFEDAMRSVGTTDKKILAQYAAEHAAGVSSPRGMRFGASPDLSVQQINIMRRAQSRAGGGAVFAETEGFLGAMREYMGGVHDEKLMAMEGSATQKASRRAQNQAAREAGEMFDMFFTGAFRKGGEGGAGITSFFSRHPLLSPTHIALGQLHRFAGDIGGEDLAFKRFIGTAEGGKALQALEAAAGGKKIHGFADIEALTQGVKKHGALGKARKAFFQTMSRNIDKYSTGEGGGRLLFPQMLVDVHYGQAGKRTIDLSIAAAQIGDFDGDIYQLLFPSKENRNKLLQKHGGEAAAQKWITNQIMYAAETSILMDEASQGIKALGQTLETGAPSQLRAAYSSAQKELIATKAGPLDVAIDRMRLGLIAAGGDSAEQVASSQRAFVLLQSLQEAGQLKAKKASVAIDLPEIVTRAVHTFNTTGNIDPVRNILNNMIFREQDILKGAGITAVDVSGLPDQASRTRVESALKGRRIDIETGLSALERAHPHVERISEGTVKTIREGMNVSQLDSAQRTRAWQHMQAGGVAQAAILQGTPEGADAVISEMNDLAGRFRQMSGAATKKMLGSLAMGAAATVGVGAIIGSAGYSPTPLLQPGEVTDSRVAAKIRRGTAFDSAGPSPEELSARNAMLGPMNMLDRPINIGQNYHEKRNAYQMRGELINGVSATEISSFISRIGGNSSIMINDTRQPITPHYINRMMGE